MGRATLGCAANALLRSPRRLWQIHVPRGALCTLQVPQQQSGSLDLPRRRHVQPLSLPREVLLYQSSVDVQEVVHVAHRRCQVGVTLAAGGFGLILVNSAALIPPAACALLLGGAAANCYALSVVARRLIRNIAARHVERLTVLPTPEPGSGRGTPVKPQDKGPASLLFAAATIEERLAVTPELHLEMQTASACRWITLADPAGEGYSEDVRGLLEDDARRRASFADICGRLRLLHVNLDAGTCSDQAFLEALMSTQKLVVEERAEPREDTTPLLATPPGASTPGPMLSEVMLSDVEQVARVVSTEPPAEAVEKIGWRARAGGMSVVGAGVLFVVGESAKDPDGVPRWKNLNLPI
uniref:Uncharacterized protein n=1 Tax=Pyrodinium bahamense TaxID=73915 RepID=A0A7S0FK08_9DINO